MSYMITRYGRRIDIPRPKQDQIHIDDIAAHLARLPRFCGATVRTYTVAQHSVHVMMLAKAAGAGDTLQLAALLHDAHEAYMGDIPTPFKAVAGPIMHATENDLQRAVLARFGVTTVYETCRAEIKRFDLVALATERRDLMHPAASHGEWPVLQGIQPDTHRLDPFALSSTTGEAEFLQCFHKLRPIIFKS